MMQLIMRFKKNWAANYFLLFITVVTISCKKTIESNTVEQKPEEIAIIANTKFLVDGITEMTMSEFQNAYNFSDDGSTANKGETTQNTCVVVDANGQNYIFTSENSLRTWASAADSRTVYINKLDSAEMWQEYANTRGILNDSVATVVFTDSVIASESAANAGPPLPLITALYDGYNYTTNLYLLPFVSFRPTLGSFNNKTSSLADYFIIPKLNMLASKTWFRGQKLFYWSYFQTSDLRTRNYDNKACSKL